MKTSSKVIKDFLDISYLSLTDLLSLKNHLNLGEYKYYNYIGKIFQGDL